MAGDAYYELPNPGAYLNKSEHIATLRQYCESKVGNPASYRIDQLADLLRRLEKGLLLYGDTSTDELRARVKEISGDEPRSQKPNRYDWIAALDRFEDERTFHDFLDLPPELRQRIYYFAFAYSDNAHHLQQPAISRTSRLVRKECLPIFYENNRFPINVERLGGGFGHQVVACRWPTYVLPKHVAMIRFFEVNLAGNKGCVRVKIDLPCSLSGGKLNIQVWSMTPEKYMTSSYLADAQQQIEKQMRPVIEEMLAASGVGAFGTREVQLMALASPEGVLLKTAKGGQLM